MGPMAPPPSRFVKQLLINEGDLLRVKTKSLQLYEHPKLLSQVLCHVVEESCLRVESVLDSADKSMVWVKSGNGWILAVDGGEESLVEIISERDAIEKWKDELNKRNRMASAVAAMLVKSYSLPRAKRLSNSLLKHALIHYPNSPLTKIVNQSIEDIMIVLGGQLALTKVQMFEYIKAAAARQSQPLVAVIEISREIVALLDDRPSTWVIDQRNVITTEEQRIHNNRFVMAAADGSIDEFERQLQLGQELTNLHSELNYTVLHAAADFGQDAMISRIVQTGLSLNIRDPKRGQTALHFAAYNGRSRVIEILLENGADRNITNNDGVLPFQLAEKQGHVECCEMLKCLPPPPPSVEATEITRHSISLLWTKPRVNRKLTPEIEAYEVQMQMVDIMDDLRDPDPMTVRVPHCTFSDLTPARTYRVRIRSRAASGWSGFSSWISLQTLAHIPERLHAPEILRVTVNSLLLHWFPPIRDNGRAVDFYELEVVDEVGSILLDNSKVQSVNGEVEDEEPSIAMADSNVSKVRRNRRRISSSEVTQTSMSHRLLKHKGVEVLQRYVTGLEPGRGYVARVRAHNECGFCSWSPWTDKARPGAGVIVTSFDLSASSAQLRWFRPLLCSSLDRAIDCFELQAVRLKGPQLVRIQTSGQSIQGDEQSSATHPLAGMQQLEDYVTMDNNIRTDEFSLFGLRAGGRYQVRVRAKLLNGDWLNWEDACRSDPFTLPATPPDPPLRVLPCWTNDQPERSSQQDERRLPKDSDNCSDGDSLSLGFTDLGAAFSDTSSYHAPVPRLNQLDDFDISHNHITITWVSGDANGEEVTEYDVEMSKVRTYNPKDVIFAREAYLGVEDEDTDNIDEFNHKLNKIVLKTEIGGKDMESQSKEHLPWMSVTQVGHFLAPQKFKIGGLHPSCAYAFRVRQRNACGWSVFSKSSPLIATHPTVPPDVLHVWQVGDMFASICWTLDQEGNRSCLTTLEYQAQLKCNRKELNNQEATWEAAESYSLGSEELNRFRRQYAKAADVDVAGCCVRNLISAQCYHIRVRVRTVVGWSPWSSPTDPFWTLG